MFAAWECDADFADFVWTFESWTDPVDHILNYNPIQNQLATNMFNRLIPLTTGTALQIVESVPHSNGIEAWTVLGSLFLADASSLGRVIW